MNKKGFSLVELMGIIIILSLISLLVIPSIDRSIKNFKIRAYDSQIQNIRLATKDWVTDNLGIYSLLENETLTISLAQLKMGGYLKDEFINPNTDEPFNDDMQINIIRIKDSLRYFVIDTSGSETGLSTNAPILTINGEFVERVPSGGNYTEKGAIASDHTKTINLTNSIVIKYYSDDTELSNLISVAPGTYTARYEISDSGLTRYVYRLVIVN